MPTWAADALTHGYDSPLLSEFAGRTPPTPVACETPTAALDELGAPTLDEDQARWEMTRAWAHAAVEGTMTPYEAARNIWWQASTPMNHPDALLASFVGLASEWEDDPGHRAAYDADIIQAAQDLLARG